MNSPPRPRTADKPSPPGRRAMLPHTRVILHQPAARADPDLILATDEVVRLRAELEAVLSRHAGQSVETLRADADRDRICTARPRSATAPPARSTPTGS